jgi:hypothetical protein
MKHTRVPDTATRSRLSLLHFGSTRKGLPLGLLVITPEIYNLYLHLPPIMDVPIQFTPSEGGDRSLIAGVILPSRTTLGSAA